MSMRFLILKKNNLHLKLFNGTLNDYLNKNGVEQLKENLKNYFDKVIYRFRLDQNTDTYSLR
jgi:hypothetical protein